MNSRQILLVDDHEMVVQAIARVLGTVEEELHIAVATTPIDALKSIATNPPDLVVIDIQLAESSGFELAETIVRRVSGCKLLFMSGQASDLDVHRAMALGGMGFILKGASVVFLREAIVRALRGEITFSPEIESRVERDRTGSGYRVRNPPALAPLSQGQVEVLRQLALGLSVKEIAARMHLSVKAIDSRKYRLMKQLQLHDKVDITRFAIREGLIEA